MALALPGCARLHSMIYDSWYHSGLIRPCQSIIILSQSNLQASNILGHCPFLFLSLPPSAFSRHYAFHIQMSQGSIKAE